jgi:uncharacterized protein with HEPN domain
MPRDARTYLWDVQSAADAIARFIAGMDAAAFRDDDMARAAVERKFEIIGEALGQLAKFDPDLAKRIPDVRAIIAFRNILIHGYAAIDHDRVLTIAQSSLPLLKSAVDQLLAELSAG